jgi:hypothetical protein
MKSLLLSSGAGVVSAGSGGTERVRVNEGTGNYMWPLLVCVPIPNSRFVQYLKHI